MKPKLKSLDEALALCESGMTLGLGGATMRRKPMSLVRGLAGSEVTDLHVWTWLGSADVDLLVGAGKVSSLDTAYVGFGAFGLAQTSRRAFVDGSVEFTDWSESSLVGAFRAGASGMPYSLTRALLGTDLAEGLAVDADNPFGDERVQATPAANPDVAFIHAQSADEFGNVRRRSPRHNDDIDHVIAASAKTVIVSVEEVDDSAEIVANRDETVIPGHYVDAVVHLPNGSFPTGCDGYYDPDIEHFRLYAEASGSEDGIAAYIDRFVADVSPEEFRELAGSGVTL